MDAFHMTLVFDVIILLLGIYLIISAVKMKKSGEISGLFLSSQEQLQCKDKRGFASFLFPRVMVLGGVAASFGIQGMCNDLLFPMGKAVNAVMVILFLVAWGWFSVSLRKGKKTYLY